MRHLFAIVILVAASRPALAQRPALAGEATYGAPGGAILVHYATTGADAVPPADADTDGVPDFVATVATTGEAALAALLALGFRRPLDDGTRGGDGRIDVYLRNLQGADGSAGADLCERTGCIGYVVAENDYAGYAYPSVLEGIRSVVPHELFHLIQYAYTMDQPAAWSEGTAVWAVEHLYGADNGDFERFLPTFLGRTYRPFDRPVGGFGDGYPYGAALWPYFLERRFGADAIVRAWEGCVDADFLDAIDNELAGRPSSIDAAWTEFTRWNAYTGPHAPGGRYAESLGWIAAPREEPVGDGGAIYVEGLSARYVPVVLTERQQLALAPRGIRIAAWLVAEGGGLDDGVELAPDDNRLVVTAEAGTYTLVVTGLSRGTITTAVDVSLGPPPVDEASGCAATPSAAAPTGVVWLLAAWRRRRRSALISSGLRSQLVAWRGSTRTFAW